MSNWNRFDPYRGQGLSEGKTGLSFLPERSEHCNPQLEARNRARRQIEDSSIMSSVPASDYEYFDRMAQELESELEGVA